jgi:hypothetical protein
MSGNWGSIPTRRSGGSRRRRVVLSAASIVVGVLLVKLAGQFFGGADAQLDGYVAVIAVLLIAGVLWDLRPWRA